MINIDGIYNALIEYWASPAFPNWSAAQFVSEVNSRGIATSAETTLYLTHFGEVAVSLAMLDAADWTTLQSRVQAVGLERAVSASRLIHQALRRLGAFRIAELQDQLASFTETIATNTTMLANAATGRAQILAQFPSSQVRNDTVAVLDAGTQMITASLARAERRKAEIEAELEQLGVEL